MFGTFCAFHGLDVRHVSVGWRRAEIEGLPPVLHILHPLFFKCSRAYQWDAGLMVIYIEC